MVILAKAQTLLTNKISDNCKKISSMNAFRLILLAGLLSVLLGCQQTNYEQEGMSEDTVALLKELKPRQSTRGQFNLYYPASSVAAGQLDEVEESLKRSKAKVLGLLQEASYDETIHILLVDSEEETAELTQFARREFTVPPDHFSIVVMDGEREPYFTRAIFKMMSVDFWGEPRDLMMFEGGAVFAQGSCLPIDEPLYQIPAHARAQGDICSVRGLILNFSDCVSERPVTTYMQAGSVFRLLFDGFGRENTQRIWTGGIRNIERIVGMAPIELEKEWTYVMENVTLGEPLDLVALNESGCL
jgi:hypothetical protein